MPLWSVTEDPREEGRVRSEGARGPYYTQTLQTEPLQNRVDYTTVTEAAAICHGSEGWR